MDGDRHLEPIQLSERRRYQSVSKFLEANPGTIGRTRLLEYVRDGRVPHVRLGKKILLPEDALDQLVIRPVAPHDLTAA